MNKRPILFTSACLLSFAGSSLATILFLLVAVFYNYFSGKIIGITNERGMEGSSRLYFLLLATAHAVSFLAILKLWNYKFNAFFLYVIAQTAIVFLPIIFLNSHAFSVTNAIFTMLFVTIYFFYYKWMIFTKVEK